jgi:hypothetical protein
VPDPHAQHEPSYASANVLAPRTAVSGSRRHTFAMPVATVIVLVADRARPACANASFWVSFTHKLG